MSTWCLMCAQPLQSPSTLCDPMDYSSPGSSVYRTFPARTLEWVAMPSSRGSSWPRDEPRPPTLQAGSLPAEPLWKSLMSHRHFKFNVVKIGLLIYFGHLMRRVDSLEKTLMLGGIGAGGRGDDRWRDGWMASRTQWMWVWVNSGSWWWTGRPGVLQFMGSQRVGHDWATELNWIEY